MTKSSDFEPGETFARELDRQDPLRDFRKEFYRPAGRIYLDGNSLGLLSNSARGSVLKVLGEWEKLGIGGWLQGEWPWFTFSEKTGGLMAPLMGAKPDEVVCTGATTVNIHSLVSTFYRPNGRRKKILADPLNFPTDLYALRDQLRLKGGDPGEDLIFSPSADGLLLEEEEIARAMDDTVALVFLPSVLYRSGQLLDMAYLAREARKRDIPIGFDCSHSAGVLRHHLDEWEVDFALWCSYKHLNGGPGSPAFLYVNRRHFNRSPAITGWFGYRKERQFDLLPDFDHQRNAGGWQISTPGMLSMAAVRGALEVIRRAGIDEIRKKSLRLTGYLIYLIRLLLSPPPYSFQIVTPPEAERRGGHVALLREEGLRICSALKHRGIIPDYRPENLIRLAPVALYNSYHEVWRTVQALREIVDRREYLEHSTKRQPVS